jgi:hypothetical protein
MSSSDGCSGVTTAMVLTYISIKWGENYQWHFKREQKNWEEKKIPANVSTSTLAGFSFFFLVGFSSSAAVLSPSKSYNFASTNCCNRKRGGGGGGRKK